MGGGERGGRRRGREGEGKEEGKGRGGGGGGEGDITPYRGYTIGPWIHTHVHKTTNVPFVYMVCDKVIWRGANPLLGPFERVGPESLEFFGDLKWHSLRSMPFKVPKKLLTFRAHPFKWPSKWICPPPNNFVPHHINKRYINS